MARVLVIEDDEVTRTLARRMLVEAGYEVEEAVDGVEGLRLFGQLSPDLVLTDINMPGLDGHDVIEAIRVMRADVPIIAISGGGPTAQDDLLLKASALGAAEIIVKPFEFRQLVGAVKRALGS
jgi:CheY-like chemotaxis protein